MPDDTGALSDAFLSALADRYRIVRDLGAGGMSTVHLAEDLKHHRQVAIKVLRADFTAAHAAERFNEEIAIAARLSHPHILPLFDSGEAAGRLFYVMPFVDGRSLRERLPHDGFPLDQAVRLLRDIADAIAYAHRHGVVHRDLKPDNIMCADRHALVVDFGVAMAIGAASGAASDGVPQTLGIVVGTPAYMSPEQAAGDPRIDHRSDIYSLGILAYEVLTGRPPFTAPTHEAMLGAQLAEEPVSVSERRVGIPEPLATLVMRCLAKRRVDRPQTAEELLAVLESLSVDPGATPRDQAAVIPARGRGRSLVVGGLLGLGAVVGVAMAFAARAPAMPSLGTQSTVTSEQGMEIEPAISPDGKFVAYTVGPIGESRVVVRQLGTDAELPLALSVDGPHRFPQWIANGMEVAFLAGGSVWTTPLLGGGESKLLAAADGQPILDFSVSHAGDRIAVVRGSVDGPVAVHALSGERLVGFEGIAQPNRPAWSPDDRFIAVVAGNRQYARGIGQLANMGPSAIALVPSTGGRVRMLTDSLSPFLFTSPAWAPDGSRLYLVSNLLGVRDIWALALDADGVPRGRPQRLTTGARAHSLAVMPDGRGLVYSSFEPRSNVWRVRIPPRGRARLEDAEQLTFENSVIETISVTADGAWLYYDAARDGRTDIFRLRIGTKEPERLTEDFADEFGPELSPDGRTIAFYGRRDGRSTIMLMDSAGGPTRGSHQEVGQGAHPKWSPDGSRLLSMNRNRIVVSTRRSDGTWSAADSIHQQTNVAAADWTVDGRAIIFASPNGIHRLGLESGRVETLHRHTSAGARGPSAVTYYVRPSPDGEHYYFRTASRAEASIWELPAAGGTPRELLHFEPPRESHRPEFEADAQYLYFTLDDRQSDLWRLEFEPPRRGLALFRR